MVQRTFCWLLFNAVSLAVATKIGSFLKLSHIAGSSYSYFSLGALLKILSGILGGVAPLLAYSTTRIAWKLLTHGCTAKIYSLHLPSLCAVLYWSHSHWSIRYALPLLCMGLFVVHPVGKHAIPYTFYW